MKKQARLLLFLLMGMLLLAACADPASETPEATIGVVVEPTVTAEPTATSISTAISEPEPTATAEATPLPEPTAEPTTEPTATTAPEPTMTPEPVVIPLTIGQPVTGSEVAVATDLTVSGQVSPDAAATIQIVVAAGTTELITGTATVDPNTGAWLTTVPVPDAVTGSARVMVSTEAENAVVDITLLPAENPSGAVLTLMRPQPGATLVAGYATFFEGIAADVVSDTLTIAVLADNCGTVAASQSFTITGGEWRGFMILPQNLSGPACAVVSTGTPGTPEWRQTIVPIVLLTADETGASRIELGNASFESYAAGSTLTLFGVAVNAPGGEIQVSASLGDTAILPVTAVEVDAFGYWELDVVLPADQSGDLTITATLESGGETITAEWVLEVG